MDALVKRHRQTTAPLGLGVLRLPVSGTLQNPAGFVGFGSQIHRRSVVSPYFQTQSMRKVGTGRDINYVLVTMKAYIRDVQPDLSNGRVSPNVGFYDESTGIVDGSILNFDVNLSTFSTLTGLKSAMQTAILAEAVNRSYSGFTSNDIIWNEPNLTSDFRSFANPSRTINSAFQISATRDAMAFYSVSIPTNLSLTGGENGAVVLEYADDSGISTNVVTVGTVRNGNTGTLTLGLNTLASMGCQIAGMIPAGKYVRLRPVDTTGSPVQAFVSAQEVLI